MIIGLTFYEEIISKIHGYIPAFNHCKQNLAEIFELENYTTQRMTLCRDFPPPPPLIPLFYPSSKNAIQ